MGETFAVASGAAETSEPVASGSAATGGAAGPLGVVLAGGAATRMGGAKMTAMLAGRPLIAWPLAALSAVLDEVVVVSKRDTPLPPLAVPLWLEPDEPRHPLAGVVHALEVAGGRAVVACAGDLPFVGEATIAALAVERGPMCVVAGPRLQPLLGRYPAAALPALAGAIRHGVAATAAARALGADVLEVDSGTLVNVNTPEDLAAAELALSART